MSTEANPTALSPRSPSPGLFGALPSERSLWPIVGSVALVALWFLRRRYNGLLQRFDDLHGTRARRSRSERRRSRLLLSARRAVVLQHLLEDRRRADPRFRPGAFGAAADRDRACPVAGGHGGSRRPARERAAEMGDSDLRRRGERRLWRASAAIRRGLRDAAAFRRGGRAGGARGAARGIAPARRALFGPRGAVSSRSWRWRARALFTSICVSKIAAGFISDLSARWASSSRPWLGLPLFSRLVERFDWNWLIVLRLRASFLFPLLWREPAWTTLAVHAVTLGLRRDSRDGPDQALVLVGDRREPRRAAAHGGFRRHLPARADRAGAAVARDLAVDAVRNHRRVFLRRAPLGGGRREPRVARSVRDRLDRRRIRRRARCFASRPSRSTPFARAFPRKSRGS